MKTVAWLVDQYDRKDRLHQSVHLSPLDDSITLDEGDEAWALCKSADITAIIAATIEKCAVIAESKCVCDSEGEQDAVDFVARNKSQRIRALDPAAILAGIK